MKRLIVVSLLLLATALIMASPVNDRQAIRIAENWILEQTGTSFTNSSVSPLIANSPDNQILVVSLRPAGYVLISGDDAAVPVIGYNTEHSWGQFPIPPQLQYMLDNWQGQLRDIVSRKLQATLPISLLWQRYDVAQGSFSPNREFRSVTPLITSLWGQGTYYNALCPSGTPVGCVATAMSQIMRYWSFPTIGQGSHSYTHPTYGVQTANFGATTYNWGGMPNSVHSANVSVATLCYQAGVAVDMDYDPSGSGAYSTDVPYALTNYFRYQNTAHLVSKSAYSPDNWDTLMRGELDNARPIYYSGSGPAGGHAWVVDGYQGTNSFHVNWGWDGYYNGYYTLAALNPGGDTFNNGQQAVIDIKPGVVLTTLGEGFEGTTFPPSNWTITAGTWARSATNFITGAFSARYNVTANGTTASGKQLRTPKLTINASSPDLTFKARAGTTLRAEEIKIGYSTSATGPYTYLANAVLSTSVQTFTRVVSGITPGDYYFVFETYSSNAQNNSKTWIIDDVTGPNLWVNPSPIASINISAWAAGSLAPGDAAYSGDIFQLSNTGQGTLTVTNVTSLSGTDYSTNFNPGVSLLTGQIHQFGFNYEPLNYGSDNMSYVITTNGGTITISLTGNALYAIFSDSFENYTNFNLTMPPWTLYDGDGLATYGVTGYSWTNSGYTGSYMCFNPSATTPAMTTGWEAHIGQKYAACWAGVPAGSVTANNDWLISPQLTLTASSTLTFWAKEYTTTYPESFNVKYSTTTNANTAFTNTLASAVVPSTTWTQYTYTLPATAKYFAIQCVSANAFCFMVDDVTVSNASTPPAPQFGNVSGYVYRSGTSTPIVNAQITAGTKTAYTNQSGFYQINNLLVGTHSLTCNARGQFYFDESAMVTISNGNTSTQDFNMTWGELAANPTSVNMALYQGETGSSSITLSNPGGTAYTSYAGYFAGAAASTRGTSDRHFLVSEKKPSPGSTGTRIPKIEAPAPDRSASWFSYASIDDANYYSGAMTERGNYFLVSDFAMMDGAVTVSQLRGYFYNPSAAAWTTNTHRTFAWKIYSVSPTGTVTLMHTSANIVLPVTATDTEVLNTYTLPTAVTIPAGYDFFVTAKPSSATDTSGRPQNLATDITTNNGIQYDATNGWALAGLDYTIDAYVDGTEWLTAYNFSGDIAPGGTANLPLNFNTVGVTAGTKRANMYVYNNSNYVTPVGGDRGDVLVIPITLNVTVATTPIAVLTGTSWTTNANVGTPSTSGTVFQLKNVGPGNLTITSATGLAGTPFTSSLNSAISLPQNGTHDFGFTFSPTAPGIYNATFTIVTNGGTKVITLKGYANYVTETFEGAAFPPDGWTALDNDADTYNWMLYTATGAAHAGLNCAGSASYVNAAKNTVSGHGTNAGRPALTPDNWLITPHLAVSTGDELSYWIGAQDPAWPAEHYSVKVSTTNNSIGSFTNTLFSETLADGDWHQRVLSLAAYAGLNIYIAFQHHECTDQFILKLDDVLMPQFAAPLTYGNISGRVRYAGTSTGIVGAEVIIGSQIAISGEDGVYSLSNVVCETYNITATAPGCQDYSAPVTILEGQTIIHDIYLDYSQILAPQTTFNLTCAEGASTFASTTLQNVGTYPLDWTSDSGVWGGDSFLQTALNQDWEDYGMTGWTGSVGPYSDLYGDVGHEGTGENVAWAFASYGTTEAQYIITPKLHVLATDALTFWYKQFNDSSETLNVLVSTTDNAIGSFTSFATVGPLAGIDWTQFSQSLSTYAGSDIYLCFQYPRIDGYQYGYVLLDQITGPAQYLPPMEWLSCAPATGTLAASGSAPLTLNANAATLPPGNYTAQTWIFGDAVNSPYKLYVNLTVLPLGTPVGLQIAQYGTYVELAWDDVDWASGYHIYATDNPYGTYQHILFTPSTYAEFTWAELAALGLSNAANRSFFKVTADTSAPRLEQLASKSNSSPALGRMPRPDKTRVLFKSK